MDATDKLKAGYEAFRNNHFEEHKEIYRDLVKNGQAPKTLLVSCSDSRVNPSTILNSDPGDLFIVRNVGNLVPPCKVDEQHHGVSSALEYGIKVLGIENIVIMGHAHCGAMQAVIDTENNPEALGTEFVHKWVQIARDAIKSPCCHSDSIKAGNRLPKEVNQASIVNSLNNLMSFPFVKERVENGTIKLHGWYFNMEDGTITAYDAEKNDFLPL